MAGFIWLFGSIIESNTMKISIRLLLLLTSLYIVSPIILFLFCWTNVWIGTILMLGTGHILRSQLKKMRNDIFFISPKTVFITTVLIILWTVLSGAGHRGIFSGDYYKHNALFNDLISLRWPVQYRLKEVGDIVYLVYYFAYYLPSALIGKWLGWQAGNIALFAWTLGGISLVFLWLYSFINKQKQLWYGLLFLLFSGLDGVGKLIMRDKVVNTEWEWWGRNWQYSGNTTLFFYVPQQALISWLLMGMLLYIFIKQKILPLQFLLLSASLLWSPFVFLGILPYYLFLLIKRKFSLSTLEIVVSVIILCVEALFLVSNMTFFSKATSANGWLWQTEKIFGSWVLLRLVLFYMFEFGLFAYFIYHYLFRKNRTTEFIIFIISLILLFFIPWYKIGLMNDFAMRASMPALYVICYFWIRALIEVKKSQLMALIMIVLFTASSLYPLILLSNGVTHFSFLSPRYTLAHLEGLNIRKQYLGYADSFFFSLFHSPSIIQ